jgi:hypothetical protein
LEEHGPKILKSLKAVKDNTERKERWCYTFLKFSLGGRHSEMEALSVGDLSFTKQSNGETVVVVTFSSTKNCKSGTFTHMMVPYSLNKSEDFDKSTYCPTTVLLDYLKVLEAKVKPENRKEFLNYPLFPTLFESVFKPKGGENALDPYEFKEVYNSTESKYQAGYQKALTWLKQGCKSLTTHSTRHGFVQLMIKLGKSMDEVKKLGRWGCMRSFQHYWTSANASDDFISAIRGVPVASNSPFVESLNWMIHDQILFSKGYSQFKDCKQYHEYDFEETVVTSPASAIGVDSELFELDLTDMTSINDCYKFLRAFHMDYMLKVPNVTKGSVWEKIGKRTRVTLPSLSEFLEVANQPKMSQVKKDCSQNVQLLNDYLCTDYALNKEDFIAWSNQPISFEKPSKKKKQKKKPKG